MERLAVTGRLMMTVLLALGGGCANGAPVGDGGAGSAEFSEPVVLFIGPDSAELASIQQRLGDDFFVVADDAMWYRAGAYEFLDSLGIPHVERGRGQARFIVEGVPTTISWRDVDRAWFTVVYDGVREPVIGSDIDIRGDVTALLRGAAVR